MAISNERRGRFESAFGMRKLVGMTEAVIRRGAQAESGGPKDLAFQKPTHGAPTTELVAYCGDIALARCQENSQWATRPGHKESA